MLLNYLKLSFRLLVRNPFFTVINVLGLAIGFASFYALWEYSTTELKADQYHKDFDRIARIGLNWRWTDDGGKSWGHLIFGFARPGLFPRVREEFPEVESSLRILNQSFFETYLVNHGKKVTISIEENGQSKTFNEEKVAYADSNLFTFFSIPLIHGQPTKVLNQVNEVVLSQFTATKYFGKKDPTGELLKLNDAITLRVSGVFKDLPHNSHLNFEMVISNAGLLGKWSVAPLAGATCYVKLNKPDFQDFETKLNERTSEYWGDILRDAPHVSLDMFVQPLKDIPFSQNFISESFYPRSKPFLFTLAFIAVSVLVMAWVNYVNLSVTRTSRRFKEIATRKVSGAGTSNMIGQFVTEAFVTNGLAIAIACTLIQIVRTPVSALFNIHIAEFSSLTFGSWIIFVFIIVTGILLSGLYPAIISMAYQPKALFSMNLQAYRRRVIPSALTISQLVVAIIFILLGFTVSLQLRHVLNMDTGINKDQVIMIEAPVVKPINYATILDSFKKDIAENSNVQSITMSSFLVNNVAEGDINAKRLGSDHQYGISGNGVDEDFIPFYGLHLLAGRNFVKDNQTDAVIISRYAATRLGFNSPEEAVASRINVRTGGAAWKEAEVIGVIEDFRNWSFLNMNESSSEASDHGRGFLLLYKDRFFSGPTFVTEKISVRASAQNFAETIAAIQASFQRQFSGMVFNWYFLDDKLNEVYAHEKVARNQIVLFTGLALTIACLGLLGMISNKAVEKTKEIGIRKVLGAQMHQIAQILLNTTFKHVAIAIALGIPASYYLTEQYLDKFSERIVLHWWHFTLPVIILVVIMFATIAFVLLKAAKSNPVEALKYE